MRGSTNKHERVRVFVRLLRETTDCSSIKNAPKSYRNGRGEKLPVIGQGQFIGPLCGGVPSKLKPLRAASQEGCVGQCWSPSWMLARRRHVTTLTRLTSVGGGRYSGQDGKIHRR
jgi:hypothetical protein